MILFRRHNRYFSWGLEFKWQDLWIGGYIPEPYYEMGRKTQELYICILPMLPLHFYFHGKKGWK